MNQLLEIILTFMLYTIMKKCFVRRIFIVIIARRDGVELCLHDDDDDDDDDCTEGVDMVSKHTLLNENEDDNVDFE